MTLRRLVALAAFPVLAAVAACTDAYAPKALYTVSADTVAVSALTGTPVQARSGINLISLATVVPGASESFDFALDIAADGKVLVLPRTKVLTCTSPCQLGVLLSPTTFDSLYDAPSRGYKYDSTTTVTPGQTVVFVTKDQSCIPSNIATYDLYAKMVVDSVDVPARRIFIRLVSDPNCGFRGLVAGIIPKH